MISSSTNTLEAIDNYNMDVIYSAISRGHDNIKENSAHIFRYLQFVNRSGTQPMKMLAALAAAKVPSVRGWCIRVAMK